MIRLHDVTQSYAGWTRGVKPPIGAKWEGYVGPKWGQMPPPNSPIMTTMRHPYRSLTR